jgi:hypothetical protein
MAKVDTDTLRKVILECFDFSMDGRVPEAQQDAFLARGKRLRVQQVKLLTAEFDEGTPVFVDAGVKLQQINEQLSKDADVLQDIAGTLENVARLVGTFDRLLNSGIAAAGLA